MTCHDIALMTTLVFGGTVFPGFESKELEVNLAPYPPLSVAERRRVLLVGERDAAMKRGAAIGTINVAERIAQWAEVVASGAKLGGVGNAAPTRKLRVWALVVNDVAIASVSGEALCELGLEVKLRSPGLGKRAYDGLPSLSARGQLI